MFLFSLKVAFPCRVFLIRGNHEFRDCNKIMAKQGLVGFEESLRQRFGPKEGPNVFEFTHQAFDWLPLAAVVARTVLVLHGGIGDGSWTVADIEAIQRPILDLSEDKNGTFSRERMIMRDCLWSDPMDGDETMHRGTDLFRSTARPLSTNSVLAQY